MKTYSLRVYEGPYNEAIFNKSTIMSFPVDG